MPEEAGSIRSGRDWLRSIARADEGSSLADVRPSRSQQPGAVSTFLATVFGNLFIVVGSLICGSLAMLSWLISPSGRLGYPLATIWGRLLLLCSGVRLQVDRPADVLAARPCIFMSNHQSLFDIPALLATLPGQTRFLAKESLLRIPIFGWALRAIGFIAVDREDRSRAPDVFAAAIDRLQHEFSVVIFPEGTRTRDGRLLPFKRGGFLLAIRAGRPIVPIGISGTRAVQPRGGFAIRPRRVSVRYGEPIPTGGLGVRDRKELMHRVRISVAALAGQHEETGEESV